ncbi:MAG: trehalose-phosphatase [Ornithinimicrobium sp.]
MNEALRAVLAPLGAAEHLLVGVDFDGTLAPLADEPMDATPVSGAMPALHALADLPHVTVALISGRALATLHELSCAEDSVVLIGSHGAERSRGGQLQLSDEEQARYSALREAMDDLLTQHPAARMELKPGAVVLHTRGVDLEAARAATAATMDLVEHREGVVVTRGKDVVEMAVTQADKGSALLDLAVSVGADVIVYAGDDVTDEDAFEQLGEDHISVKVGSGSTAARYRVTNEHSVVAMLEILWAVRATRTLGPSKHPDAGQPTIDGALA